VAKKKDRFLEWLAAVAARPAALTPRQQRLMLAALVDLMRHAPPHVRHSHHLRFRRWWSPTLLFEHEFEAYIERVLAPRRRPGRPPSPVRWQYPALVFFAEDLARNPPSLAEFRRLLEKWRRGLRVDASRYLSPATVSRLYQMVRTPEPLTVAFLAAIHGKSVKQVQRLLRPPRRPGP
jgi:hypothetical protein